MTIRVQEQDGRFRVLFGDAHEPLFEGEDQAEAFRRASTFSGIAKERGAKTTAEELRVLFPPTAPAPLIFLSAAEAAAALQREDVFHEPSGTWTLKNVEIFRSGVALKSGKRLPFTTGDVVDFIEAFEALGWQPPAKITHSAAQPVVLRDLPSIARIAALRAAKVESVEGKEELGLFADLERVPEVLREAIRGGLLPQRSIEFWRNKVERTDGKEGTFPLVLKAVALLPANELPAVRGMRPLDDVAPVTFEADDEDAEIVNLSLDSTRNPMTKDPTKGDPGSDVEQVTLTVAEYEKLKGDTESAKSKAEAHEREAKELRNRVARLEVDRRRETAQAHADRLETEGRITPALKPYVIELLSVADRDDSEAVTVILSNEDGGTEEKKMSQHGLVSALLSALPKNPNAPGNDPRTRGGKKDPNEGEFHTLSYEEQRSKIAEVGDKYLAAKVEGVGTEIEAYELASKHLEAGTVVQVGKGS